MSSMECEGVSSVKESFFFSVACFIAMAVTLCRIARSLIYKRRNGPW